MQNNDGKSPEELTSNTEIINILRYPPRSRKYSRDRSDSEEEDESDSDDDGYKKKKKNKKDKKLAELEAQIARMMAQQTASPSNVPSITVQDANQKKKDKDGSSFKRFFHSLVHTIPPPVRPPKELLKVYKKYNNIRECLSRKSSLL